MAYNASVGKVQSIIHNFMNFSATLLTSQQLICINK